MSASRNLVYIAGPMSGYPEFNAPAFAAAKARLEAAGLRVITPVEIGESVFGSSGGGVPAAEYLRADLRWVCSHCDAIALLDGWEHSVGARCEVVVAITLGMTFRSAETGAIVPRPVSVLVDRGYLEPHVPGVTDA